MTVPSLGRRNSEDMESQAGPQRKLMVGCPLSGVRYIHTEDLPGVQVCYPALGKCYSL